MSREKNKKQIGGNIPIEPLTTEGRFRYCGKCIMCEKYYNENPDYRPPVYDPSQPDPRTPFQTKLRDYIRDIETKCEDKNPSSLEFFDDEYVLACTCSLMKSTLGSTSSWNGVGNPSISSVFITNYGRLYNIHANNEWRPPVNWYLQPNPYATVDLQTENPHPLTQEYLDIFNNLLEMGNVLLQTKDANVTYNGPLFYMLVDNFNKYQNMLMPRDIVDPLAQFRVDKGDQELDEVIQELEKSPFNYPAPVLPRSRSHQNKPKLSPKFKISQSDFNKSRRTLRKMIGSKKKKKYKHKKEKKEKKDRKSKK